MSEPIVLYAKDGKEVVVYGKAQAAVLVEAGEAFQDKPKKVAADSDDDAAETAKKVAAAQGGKSGK